MQIEEHASIENVDAITAAEGHDALFIGPSDLWPGMGTSSNPRTPTCRRALRILEAGKKHGKAGAS